MQAFLLVMGQGFYDLFISRIEDVRAEGAPRVLLVRTFDDLKDRVARLILLVLLPGQTTRATLPMASPS